MRQRTDVAVIVTCETVGVGAGVPGIVLPAQNCVFRLASSTSENPVPAVSIQKARPIETPHGLMGVGLVFCAGTEPSEDHVGLRVRTGLNECASRQQQSGKKPAALCSTPQPRDGSPLFDHGVSYRTCLPEIAGSIRKLPDGWL